MHLLHLVVSLDLSYISTWSIDLRLYTFDIHDGSLARAKLKWANELMNSRRIFAECSIQLIFHFSRLLNQVRFECARVILLTIRSPIDLRFAFVHQNQFDFSESPHKRHTKNRVSLSWCVAQRKSWTEYRLCALFFYIYLVWFNVQRNEKESFYRNAHSRCCTMNLTHITNCVYGRIQSVGHPLNNKSEGSQKKSDPFHCWTKKYSAIF